MTMPKGWRPKNTSKPNEGNTLKAWKEDTTKQRENIVTINATAIAGSLIFLSFSQVGVALAPFINTTDQIAIAQYYKGIGALFALGFLGPFCISTACVIMKDDCWVDAARLWTMAGIILIPILATTLVVVYFLTGAGLIGYIPPPKT